MIQGELDRPFQMFIDTALLFIGKGDDFIQKAGISCLGNIFIDCREQPKGIVCPVCGMSRSLYIGRIVRSIFMSRVMGELYKRKSSPVVYLGRQHETYFFSRHLRGKMDDPLDILHCVTVAVSVAQTAVDERGSPGPDEGYEAVIGIPGIDHSVKGGTGSLYLEMIQSAVPVCFQRFNLLEDLFLWIFVGSQNFCTLFRGIHSQDKEDGFGFSRL